MTDEERVAYEHALRVQLAERRALWAILQEMVGRYALTFDEPAEALENIASRVIARLSRKDEDALAKGLELNLAYVKDAVDRFFGEMAERREKGDL